VDTLLIGHIIDRQQNRDAVHMAIAPVVASEYLLPGQRVNLANGLATLAGEPVGIVDPFLRGPIEEGQRFWLFLFPGSITSLRHDWTHPSFPDGEPLIGMEAAKAWLREFAQRVDVESYEDLIEGTREYLDPQFDRPTRWGCGFEVPDEFWIYYQVVTGQKFATHPEFFSCSC
jgi:hypothetical protein